jgi:hypothetical protein
VTAIIDDDVEGPGTFGKIGQKRWIPLITDKNLETLRFQRTASRIDISRNHTRLATKKILPNLQRDCSG